MEARGLESGRDTKPKTPTGSLPSLPNFLTKRRAQPLSLVGGLCGGAQVQPFSWTCRMRLLPHWRFCRCADDAQEGARCRQITDAEAQTLVLAFHVAGLRIPVEAPFDGAARPFLSVCHIFLDTHPHRSSARGFGGVEAPTIEIGPVFCSGTFRAHSENGSAAGMWNCT